jgi:hypothetical protein
MTTQMASRADQVSAWAIGVGIGLIALQLTWLVTARLAGLVWAPPVGPTVAFATACVTGVIVTIIAGRRLSRKVTGSHNVS